MTTDRPISDTPGASPRPAPTARDRRVHGWWEIWSGLLAGAFLGVWFWLRDAEPGPYWHSGALGVFFLGIVGAAFWRDRRTSTKVVPGLVWVAAAVTMAVMIALLAFLFVSEPAKHDLAYYLLVTAVVAAPSLIVGVLLIRGAREAA